MPFTVSHAVVALPFVRTALPFGAVAVGAMTPDLPLFFPFAVSYELTHGFPSLLLVSVPLGVTLYLVWRVLLRPAAHSLSPRFVAERLPAAWDRVGRPTALGTLAVIAAVAIGVVSHVLWDEFTHPARLGSEWLPVLAEQWGFLPGTQWLQYLSSVGGLAVLAVVTAIWVRRTPRRPTTDLVALRWAYWGALALAAVVGVVTTLAAGSGEAGFTGIRGWAFSAGTLTGALMLLVTAVAAVVSRVVGTLR